MLIDFLVFFLLLVSGLLLTNSHPLPKLGKDTFHDEITAINLKLLLLDTKKKKKFFKKIQAKAGAAQQSLL